MEAILSIYEIFIERNSSKEINISCTLREKSDKSIKMVNLSDAFAEKDFEIFTKEDSSQVFKIMARCVREIIKLIKSNIDIDDI